MYYYHFVADTPYCGTEEHYFFEYETPLTTKEINEQCQELAIHNGECYFYLVSGWAEDWDDMRFTINAFLLGEYKVV